MRTGEVITRAVFVETVNGERTILDILIGIDRLVAPVPDATTDTIGTVLDDIPIFCEVTHGITHGMSILTHEVGLLTVVAVGIAITFSDVGVHHREEVGGRSARTSSSLIVDDTVVEFAHSIVGVSKVTATVTLVTQAPEDDRGEVTVAQHHAYGAVDVLVTP